MQEIKIIIDKPGLENKHSEKVKKYGVGEDVEKFQSFSHKQIRIPETWTTKQGHDEASSATPEREC